MCLRQWLSLCSSYFDSYQNGKRTVRTRRNNKWKGMGICFGGVVARAHLTHKINGFCLIGAADTLRFATYASFAAAFFCFGLKNLSDLHTNDDDKVRNKFYSCFILFCATYFPFSSDGFINNARLV